jgi:excisionase family DNA binding protein
MRKTTPPLPPPVTMPLIDMDPIQRHGYSPEEAALSLGLGRTSTFALIKDGKLGVVRLGRKIIVPVAEIRAFLEREMTRGAEVVEAN